MHPWEIRFVSGGRFGIRQVWAPDHHAAERVLIENASWFGLNEHVRILKIVRMLIQEQTIPEPAEADAA